MAVFQSSTHFVVSFPQVVALQERYLAKFQLGQKPRAAFGCHSLKIEQLLSPLNNYKWVLSNATLKPRLYLPLMRRRFFGESPNGARQIGGALAAAFSESPAADWLRPQLWSLTGKAGFFGSSRHEE